jgi:predicted nucleotidyltransferase
MTSAKVVHLEKTYNPFTRYHSCMAHTHTIDIAKFVAILSPVFKKNICDFVYLGGSVAEGTSGWWSDIDFFVHTSCLDSKDANYRFNWLGDLTLSIVKLLETDAVHVSFLVDLPLNVQYNVISKGKVIYERDDGTLRADFIEWMLPSYFDFKIWYTRMINEWTY